MTAALLESLDRQINESNKQHATNLLALMIILFDKGIISQDELDKSTSKATHIIDQEWAKNKKNIIKKFKITNV